MMREWKIAIASADEAPLSAPLLLRGNILENIPRASALGYDALEVHLRENENLDLVSIKASLDANQIKISALVTGRLMTEGECSLLDDRPYSYEAAIEGLKKYIDLASELNTNIIIGWVKGNIPAGKTRDKYMKRLAKRLKIISDYAVDKEVDVFLEVINRYEVNVFTTAKETMGFLEDNNLPNLYVHLDTFHMNIDESDPYEAIKICGDKLGYFHLADNTRRYPGSGTINFKKILEALNCINYNGYLSVECLPIPSEKEAAEEALKYLKSITKKNFLYTADNENVVNSD
jgi:sugar phosphate isomerase/epimerase